jgi:hypothetical protein
MLCSCYLLWRRVDVWLAMSSLLSLMADWLMADLLSLSADLSLWSGKGLFLSCDSVGIKEKLRKRDIETGTEEFQMSIIFCSYTSVSDSCLLFTLVQD